MVCANHRLLGLVASFFCLALSGGEALSQANPPTPENDATANVTSEYEDYVPRIVFFPAAKEPPPSAFQQKIAKKKGLTLEEPKADQVFGRLYLPAGEGPHPAVVLLHGATGIWDWNDLWAERLRGWGYVVLDVDSYSPRGLYRHNIGAGSTDTGLRRRFIGAFPRALDALGAAAYLAQQPYVRGDAIAVLGASQGGLAAMQALGRENPRNEGQFKAGVALYAPCDQLSGVTAPLLVLQGEEDQWISLKRCNDNLGPLVAEGDLELVIYPGAHHVFDFEAPDREMAGRPLRYNAEADADAISRIKAFLATEIP